MNLPWSAALIGCLLSGLPAAAADPEASGTECPGGLETRIVPLPVYAALPNEGDTFGVMPVFLRVCDANQRTDSIIAPSVTWNDVIHATGTFRGGRARPRPRSSYAGSAASSIASSAWAPTLRPRPRAATRGFAGTPPPV